MIGKSSNKVQSMVGVKKYGGVNKMVKPVFLEVYCGSGGQSTSVWPANHRKMLCVHQWKTIYCLDSREAL
jgi:hypothetical protein